jgi:anion-transporting  ArsA/GET3 family ATPase
MSKNIFKLTAVFAAIFLVSSQVSTFAVSPLQLKPEIRNQNKLDQTEARCERINERIEAKIQKYTENQNRYHGIYQGVMNRLANTITRLEGAGVDTAALEENQAEMQEKVDAIKDSYQVLIDKLEDSKQYTCGESEGDFVKALGEIKTQMSKIREQIEEVRKYFDDEVIPNIKALKEEYREMKRERAGEQE